MTDEEVDARGSDVVLITVLSHRTMILTLLESGEWLCHHDSTINIVLELYIYLTFFNLPRPAATATATTTTTTTTATA